MASGTRTSSTTRSRMRPDRDVAPRHLALVREKASWTRTHSTSRSASFSKHFGVTAQREIENAVRKAIEEGKLRGDEARAGARHARHRWICSAIFTSTARSRSRRQPPTRRPSDTSGASARCSPSPRSVIRVRRRTASGARCWSARIELLVDIRAVASSRRPGFSKSKLAASVADAGIDYLHLRALGTPADGRAAARAGHHAEMRTIFLAHMATPDAQAALGDLAELVRSGRRVLSPVLRGRSRPLSSQHRRIAARRQDASRDHAPRAGRGSAVLAAASPRARSRS